MRTELRRDRYFELRGISPDAYKNAKVPKTILGALPKNKDAKILDIGCGLGQYLACLKELGYSNCSGIDISANAVRECRALGLNVRLVKDITKFTCNKGDKYDFVIMTHVLEHLEKDRIVMTLNHIRDVLLDSRGSLLLAVPNAQSNTGAYWYFEDFTHNFLFTTGSLLYVLRASGFHSIQFLDSYHFDDITNPVKRSIKKLLLGLFIGNKKIWNMVTQSSYHSQSPMIFSYELICLSRQ